MTDFPQNSYVFPVSVSSPRPSLFALLIGIDSYEAAEIPSLRGAVADACAFKDYLMAFLRVPSYQIRGLLGKEASRSAIIKAFRDLKHDPRIKKGDPIFIFFAGHGSEMLSPREWETSGAESNIQVIVPQDYCQHQGREVRAIPDRTLGALLKDIADEKGNNITVVFDCCHAASGTRGSDSVEDILSMTLTRSVELESTIPEDLDKGIWDIDIRGMRVPPGYQYAGLNSHVLLAACGSGEKAKETRGHGEFSTALLTLLRTNGPDNLRYVDILNRMYPIPSQNPQCEGINQNRYLFDGKVLPSTRPCYAIQRQQNGSFVLQAGSAHGVTERTIFAVYPNSESIYERPSGDFVVSTLSHFSSIMAPLSESLSYFNLPPRAVAVQRRAGLKEDLRVYIGPQDRDVVPLVRNSSKHGLSNVAIVPVNYEQDAHLAISLDRKKVVFRVTDYTATQYGYRRQFDYDRTELHDDPKRLSYLLTGVARYYWLLQTHNQQRPQLMNNIQVEFYRLGGFSSENSDLHPIGRNLCKEGRIEFFLEEGCAYGMKLTNHGPFDVFPTVFYFDNSDLTVEIDYQPPTSGPYKADVPLKKTGGNLTIGYGDGGSSPKSYILRQGQNVEVGFFKILISTKPLGNLSHLTQDVSPFEYHRGAGRSDWKRLNNDIWGTLVLPIIYHRYVPPSSRRHYQLLQQSGDMRLAL